MHQEILESTVKERQLLAEKMKMRWDTVNTQKVQVGNFVLTEKHLYEKVKNKIKQKRPLGEPLFVRPAKVIQVSGNGCVVVQFKGTEVRDTVASNKFKVVPEEIYQSTDYNSDLEKTSSSSECEEPQFSELTQLVTNKTRNATVTGYTTSATGATNTISTKSNNVATTKNSTSNVKVVNKKNKNNNNNDNNWEPTPGLKVLIYWKGEDKWFAGTVKKWSPSGKSGNLRRWRRLFSQIQYINLES
jgi:hypothetical protein